MAKAWGLTPREWRAQPVDDQGRMMAFVNFEALREAYRNEEREKRRKTKGKSGKNDYELMREKMNARAGLEK